MADFSDVDQWGENYKPAQGFSSKGPELIPPGEYDLLILGAELTKSPKGAESIFKMQLQVVGGEYDGRKFERVSFFRTQDNVAHLGKELETLGFDTEFWGKRGKTLSQELQAVCPQLKGITFRGRREDTPRNDGKGANYSNLWINSLISAAPLNAAELDQSIPF